ncbi:hypothetical protein C8Q80DRAFT_1204575 [Daedaleopsis nitida]|nr:hypothetical protein C8Q80DRAFT_1204575 [Daedaleopsis nitida]
MCYRVTSDGQVQFVECGDLGKANLWNIGDEQRRLSDLPKSVRIVVDRMSSWTGELHPPLLRCRRPTWNRLAHAHDISLGSVPCWISAFHSSESLMLGNLPFHDVCCSRCGHLTTFRNPSGNEGATRHIAQASAYNWRTRTFAQHSINPIATHNGAALLWLALETHRATRHRSSALQSGSQLEERLRRGSGRQPGLQAHSLNCSSELACED